MARLLDRYPATFAAAAKLASALRRHQAVRTANAMAFDLFLAMVPMLGLTGWLVSVLLSRSPEALLEGSVWLNLTPNEFHDFLGRHLGAFSGGGFAPLAVLSAWWLSSNAFATLIGVFEETLDSERRTWLAARLLSLGFALLGMVLFALSGVVTFMTTFEGFGIGELVARLPLGGSAVRLGLLGASLASLVAFVALIYRYSIRRQSTKRRVWPGALLAVGIGTISSVGLAYYASNIARYALFYGSLAAVVVLLLWLWLWCSALLLGAEVNFALEGPGAEIPKEPPGAIGGREAHEP